MPAQARGEAMGLYGSAMTIGMALGAPLAGAVADRAGAGWSFVAVGTVGVLLALAGLAANHHANRQAARAPGSASRAAGTAPATAAERQAVSAP